jgi:propionyl-CoA carboxylase alpha chain
MGSKVRAKQLMRAAGVPVLEVVDPPASADLPLIVKASAGGGGRGMRIVEDLDRLDEEIAAARAEAESAFGDGTVFVEPYLPSARHVEVQVLGCPDGTVVVLGDRDCSVQRRHQKVVEEAPAPGLGSEVRAALHEAARTAALTVGYLGAGTVEFLYDPATTRFFFLEMNTRLQVEHPVTELVLGVDLVALQLAVAEGRSCAPRRPMDRAQAHDPSGHAIEVRLYAEDPAAAYTPQSGTLTTFEIPDGPGLRVDAGYESGSVVSTYYDAMLAKVIVHAESRDQAARTLAGVLARARIHGLTTNRDQLVAVLRDPDFLAGHVSTAFLEQHPPTPARPAGDHAVAAALALAECERLTRTVQQRIPVAWRNVVSQPQTTRFDLDTVEWWGGRDGYAVDGLAVVAAHPASVTLERDGVATTYAVSIAGDRVDVDAATGHVALTVLPRFTDPAETVASGSLLAPMPGTVVSVAVEQGQTVVAGAPVLVLEAMKMQHTVRAPGPGTVTRLDVRPGAQVAAGQVLAVVEETE